MNCPHCGSPLSPNFCFCMNCGTPVDSDATVILPASEESPSVSPQKTAPLCAFTEEKPPKKKNSKLLTLIIVILMVLLFLAFVTVIFLDFTDTISFIDFLPLASVEDDENKDDDSEKYDKDKAPTKDEDEKKDKDPPINKDNEMTTSYSEPTLPVIPTEDTPENPIEYFSDQPDAYYRVFNTGYSGLNLRQENNTDAEIIKVLQESEIVLVYGIEDGWAFVKTDDPRTESDIYGWCSTEFLQYHSAY